MPRYFFDVNDRGRRVVDKLGIEHVDLAQAVCDAVFPLKVLAIEGQFEGRPGLIQVTVREATTGSGLTVAISATNR